MAARGTTFAKQDRDRAKKAKAALKRERRQGRNSDEVVEDDDAPITIGEEVSAAELLRLVEELHQRFADKRIDFEEFEERKAELMARITV